MKGVLQLQIYANIKSCEWKVFYSYKFMLK